MVNINIDEYDALDDTGFISNEPSTPEKDFFHSVYVAGKTRKNHIGVTEELGKLQVRGVEYNKDKIYMIITHIKPVLMKTKRVQNRDQIECFSYQIGPPENWRGTNNGRKCPRNSVERAANSWCNGCKSQLIVAGIYTDQSGRPVTGEDNKPIFIFIRGRGVKYQNVSNYLSDLSKMELPPITQAKDEEALKRERKLLNHKRFVTQISVGKFETQSYGIKDVFSLEKGTQIPDDKVQGILNVAQKTVDKFHQKFDWSKGRQTQSADYVEKPPVTEDQKFSGPENKPEEQKAAPTEDKKAATEQKKALEGFNFESLEF
jgi:hypothetical protein